mmetsp:Transcript_42146/g.126167  ORF Transcript_42146/g.126167 Transcript_42146/m.126167 type:complete len:627 (+) Transcript_42146:727-2607(+)
MVAIFTGACYTTPLIGAIIADSLLGRFRTILAFSTIYLLGIFLLTLSSWPPAGGVPGPGEDPTWWSYTILFSALGVIALGTGGIKPNVSAFGADQFNLARTQDRREKESFFNAFYASINLGSLIACTAVVYVQDQVSWTLGFAIPGFAMLLAICIFLAGRSVYVHVPPTESPVLRVIRVIGAALKNRRRKKKQLSPPSTVSHDDSLRAGQRGLTAAGRQTANGGNRADVPVLTASMSHKWLDDAITEWHTSQGQHMRIEGLTGYSPQQVEEVKLVLRLLPVFLSSILYWTIYTQMGAMFVNQGNIMNRDVKLGSSTVTMPAASMAVFNTISIILLIWVYDRLFEPGVRRLGYNMTMLRRAGWGMVIAALAMGAAAIVEAVRLRAYYKQFCTPCELDGPAAAGTPACGCNPGVPDVSIFWQAPQYVLIGLSEVFTSIAQIEFFYDQAPDVMRSCSMALGLLSTAMGSYLSGLLTYLVTVVTEHMGHQWLPKDLNQGRLDLFFLLMMVLMVANTAAFVAVAINYQYKTVEHKETRARHVKAAPTHLRSRSSPQVLESLVVPPQWISGPAAAQPMPFPSSSQPMAIGRRTPFTNVVPAESSDEEGDEDVEQYSRSLTYQPFLKTRGAPH